MPFLIEFPPTRHPQIPVECMLDVGRYDQSSPSMNNYTYILHMVNVLCSMKFSYSFVYTNITLFLTVVITHAQYYIAVDLDVNVVDTDGAIFASL